MLINVILVYARDTSMIILKFLQGFHMYDAMAYIFALPIHVYILIWQLDQGPQATVAYFSFLGVDHNNDFWSEQWEGH